MAANSIVPGHEDRCADLVLEGGGVKGIALVGVLSVLEERGYRFARVAGTSAGAIVGALAAAGMPTDEMATVMEELDYRRFQDARGFARLPGGKALALLTSHGIYHGDYLEGWLAERLGEYGVKTFGDLRGTDPETSLPAEKDYRLVVMVSDITQGALRRLPWDYDRYGRVADDAEVAEAVRASMSIPFFYRPVKLTDRRTDRRCWLVDGGMLSNFPVACFDRSDGQRPRWPTFGVKLSDRPVDGAAPFNVRGVVSMTRAMAGTMMSFYDRLHLDAEDTVARTIFVDTQGVRATDFHLSKTTQRQLFDNGRTAAERFLDGADGQEPWDFDAYLQRFHALPGSGRSQPRPGVGAPMVASSASEQPVAAGRKP